MDNNFYDRLFKTFSVEAEEHLFLMSAGLLKLEKIASPAVDAPEIIEEVYREAHSLKGASRAVGLSQIEFLLQNMETYFSLVKKKELDPEPNHFDLLFKAIDLTKEFLNLKKQGVDDSEGEDSIRLLTEEIKVLAQGMPLEHFVEHEVKTVQQEEEIKRDEEFATYNLNLNKIRKKLKKNQEHSGVPKKESVNFPEAEVITTEAPATPIKKNEEHRPLRVTPETIRVSTSKIDDLRSRTEELLTIKLNYDQLLSDLRKVNSQVESEQKGIERLAESLKRLSQLTKELPSEVREQFKYISESVKTLVESSYSNSRHVNEVVSSIKKQKSASHRLINEVSDQAQTLLMLPFSFVLDFLPKSVRDLAKHLDKEVNLVISGADIEVDRRILEELKDPLLHIVRNSVDHGIEKPEERIKAGKPSTGRINIEITGPIEGNIEMVITDDGRGLDVETLRLKGLEKGIVLSDDSPEQTKQKIEEMIFDSGVTTSGVVTDISGRGLGMSIVKEKVEKLKGSISLKSESGKSMQVVLKLPVTISSTRGVLVKAGNFKFILESQFVEKIARIPKSRIKYFGNGYGIQLEERIIPLSIIKSDLGIDNRPVTDEVIPSVFITSKGNSLALAVDEIYEEQEIIIKPFQVPIDGIKTWSGATVLGDGRLYPVLSAAYLLGIEEVNRSDRKMIGNKRSVDLLVVDDSVTSRTLLLEILEFAGFKVDTAEDGVEAYRMLMSKNYDLLVSDIEMPNMNGLDLTSKVRETSSLKNLPVILVTGLAKDEDKERGIKAGANAYILKKSFDQSVLIETINFLLEKKDN
ncbi:MAG: response regulator [Ignavibacteriaceae bacterium]|nr:response regulator [Ignavibacteriales bacterium]MCC6637069.1 response regulator [Ignavibacteriaceae bacterium]